MQHRAKRHPSFCKKRERDMRDAGPECRFDTCRSSLPFICGVIFHNRVAGSTFNGAAKHHAHAHIYSQTVAVWIE